MTEKTEGCDDDAVADEEMLSTAEVAARLGVSDRWVRQLLREGALRGVETVKGYGVPLAEVERYEEEKGLSAVERLRVLRNEAAHSATSHAEDETDLRAEVRALRQEVAVLRRDVARLLWLAEEERARRGV